MAVDWLTHATRVPVGHPARVALQNAGAQYDRALALAATGAYGPPPDDARARGDDAFAAALARWIPGANAAHEAADAIAAAAELQYGGTIFGDIPIAGPSVAVAFDPTDAPAVQGELALGPFIIRSALPGVLGQFVTVEVFDSVFGIVTPTDAATESLAAAVASTAAALANATAAGNTAQADAINAELGNLRGQLAMRQAEVQALRAVPPFRGRFRFGAYEELGVGHTAFMIVSQSRLIVPALPVAQFSVAVTQVPPNQGPTPIGGSGGNRAALLARVDVAMTLPGAEGLRADLQAAKRQVLARPRPTPSFGPSYDGVPLIGARSLYVFENEVLLPLMVSADAAF